MLQETCVRIASSKSDALFTHLILMTKRKPVLNLNGGSLLAVSLIIIRIYLIELSMQCYVQETCIRITSSKSDVLLTHLILITKSKTCA